MTQKNLLQSAGDGTAIPAGYVGEVVNSTMTTGVQVFNTATEADITGASLTLQPGIWRLTAEINVDISGSGGTVGGAIKLTNASNVVIGRGHRGLYSTSSQEIFNCVTISEIVTLNSATTYKIRAVRFGTTGVINIYIGESNYGYSTFYATRIA